MLVGAMQPGHNLRVFLLDDWIESKFVRQAAARWDGQPAQFDGHRRLQLLARQ
jgi:hypothetical protein